MTLRQRVRDFKIALGASAADLSKPGARRRAWWHFMVFDHAILRIWWTNFAEIAPGVYRSNHPSPNRLKTFAARGIASVVNLRGASDGVHYALEAEACDALGLDLIDVPGLMARQAPKRRDLVHMLDAIRTAPKPTVLHCKSGADRTSLAAAIYLLAECDASVAQARKQFSPRFIHFKWTKTGVLDHILDRYAEAQAGSGIAFEDWLTTAYNGKQMQASFDASRK